MGKRHYKIILTTAGPVHIGNGETYGRKDYLIIDDKHLGVLDALRFVGKLKDDEREAYCRFLQETNSRTGLQDFLDRHPNLKASALECVTYKVEKTLAKRRGGSFQYLDVFQCVKDPCGKPYVPGSSVKGMLRTALLSYLVQRDRTSYVALYDSVKVLDKGQARVCKDIERRAFWKEKPNTSDASVVNDIMRYVSVSDSNLLATDDLVFVKKYDRFSRNDLGLHKRAMGKISKDPAYRQGNEIDLYRECIKPGVSIELTLDVDDRIDAYLGGLVLDRDGIAAVLDASFKLYEQSFLECFDLEGVEGVAEKSAGANDGRCRYVYENGVYAGRRCRNPAVGDTGYCNIHKSYAGSADKQSVCYLGGGVDFNSKTVHNALFEDDSARVYEISRVLYAQFPTRLDRKIHRELETEVREAGFEPQGMTAKYSRGKLTKGKEDHRHWKDAQLGVSPHTLKLGIIGTKKYLMGRCTITIGEGE